MLGALAWSPSAWAYTTTPSEDLRVWAEIPDIVVDGETVNYIKVYEHTLEIMGVKFVQANGDATVPAGGPLAGTRRYPCDQRLKDLCEITD